MKPVRLLIIIALAGLLAGPHAAQASGKHFTTLNAPHAGTAKGQGTTLSSINQRGDVVGYYVHSKGVQHGVLWHNGKFTTVNYPGASRTQAAVINDRGDIVGNYSLPGSNGARAFLEHNGKFTTLHVPKSATPIRNFANGINDAGDIVGQYFDAKGVSHGFLLHHGKFTTIDHPKAGTTTGWMGTYPNRISLHGDIVGSYVDSAGVRHGYLRHNGTYTTIDAPKAIKPQGEGGGAGTVAFDISPNGDIVGMYFDSKGMTHGYLLHQGTYTTINHPQAAAARVEGAGTIAYGISPQGTVVGAYTDRKGVSHGFLWR